MSNWIKATAAEYDGQHKTASINMEYPALKALIGEPFLAASPDYPDDDHKTDVCWGFKTKAGDAVAIWNYKNGPNYAGDEVPTIDDIYGFSVYATSPAAFDDFVERFAIKGEPTK